MNIVQVIATILANASGLEAEPWKIVQHKLVDEPNTCIAVILAGGRPANPKYLLDYPSVQIMIRGNVGVAVDTLAKATACKNVLLGIDSQDVVGGRLVSMTLLGDINNLGWDDKNRPIFSINLNLITEPNTSADSNRVAL